MCLSSDIVVQCVELKKYFKCIKMCIMITIVHHLQKKNENVAVMIFYFAKKQSEIGMYWHKNVPTMAWEIAQ